MSKERIFELVRNEELLLFVGAGMSRYAGYPSGAELAEILHENLPSDLREHIVLTWDLSEIADNIYSGLCCFIKLITREIKTILNFDS